MNQLIPLLIILLALNGLLVWKIINDIQNGFEQLKRINTSDFEVLFRLNTEVSINKVATADTFNKVDRTMVEKFKIVTDLFKDYDIQIKLLQSSIKKLQKK